MMFRRATRSAPCSSFHASSSPSARKSTPELIIVRSKLLPIVIWHELVDFLDLVTPRQCRIWIETEKEVVLARREKRSCEIGWERKLGGGVETVEGGQCLKRAEQRPVG